MYIFEIPTIDVTFVKENKESELTSYSIQLLDLQHKIKTRTETDIRNKRIMIMVGSLMNPYNASFYNMKNTKQYWNLLEYKYTKKEKKSGCYIDEKSMSWCGNPGISPEPFYYTKSEPKEKYDYITYRIIKRSSAEKIHIDDIHDLDGNLEHLRTINKYLKVGGSALFIAIGNYNTTNGHLAFPYLLKSFFKKVIVCVTGYCIGVGYNGKILEEDGYPYIPSESIKRYTQFVRKVRHDTIICYELLLKEDKLPFFREFHKNTIALWRELYPPLSKLLWNLVIFTLLFFRINVVSTGVLDIKLKSHVYFSDGYMLYNLIINNNLKNILEIGFASGISSTYALLALKEIKGHLTSIDPDEKKIWNNIGLKMVEFMRLKTYHTFIEESFYKIGPTLLSKKEDTGIYDLVMINPYISLDLTLTDIYFADKCVHVGGYLSIDNYRDDKITIIIQHIISHFTNYKQIILDYDSDVIIFKKTKPSVETYVPFKRNVIKN